MALTGSVAEASHPARQDDPQAIKASPPFRTIGGDSPKNEKVWEV